MDASLPVGLVKSGQYTLFHIRAQLTGRTTERRRLAEEDSLGGDSGHSTTLYGTLPGRFRGGRGRRRSLFRAGATRQCRGHDKSNSPHHSGNPASPRRQQKTRFHSALYLTKVR